MVFRQQQDEYKKPEDDSSIPNAIDTGKKRIFKSPIRQWHYKDSDPHGHSRHHSLMIKPVISVSICIFDSMILTVFFRI